MGEKQTQLTKMKWKETDFFFKEQIENWGVRVWTSCRVQVSVWCRNEREREKNDVSVLWRHWRLYDFTMAPECSESHWRLVKIHCVTSIQSLRHYSIILLCWQWSLHGQTFVAIPGIGIQEIPNFPRSCTSTHWTDLGKVWELLGGHLKSIVHRDSFCSCSTVWLMTDPEIYCTPIRLAQAAELCCLLPQDDQARL